MDHGPPAPSVVGRPPSIHHCQIEAPLLRRGMLTLGRIGAAEPRLINSRGLVKWATRQVKKGPEYLLRRISDAP